jgi:hypothetical protein
VKESRCIRGELCYVIICLLIRFIQEIEDYIMCLRRYNYYACEKCLHSRGSLLTTAFVHLSIIHFILLHITVLLHLV